MATILVAEDSMTQQMLMREILERAGHNVLTANNGSDALKIAYKEKPSLVITDVNMPEMDGYEVCRQLKENKFTCDIPVIFVTSMDDIEDERKGFELGAVDYITKPISPSIVQARVKTHLSIKENLRTQTNLNKELRKLNMVKNKFMGIAAHDLRGPIGTIREFAKLIKEAPEDVEGNKEPLDIIARLSNEMLTLIEDLLDVSVIESGKFDLRLETGNLSDLIDFRVMLQEKTAQSKNILLCRNLANIPEIKFDADRISQVIDNLVSNAIKYSESGTKVQISCAKEDNTIVFAVQDEGRGIPVEDQKKLFGTFEKLSVRPTGDERSTGLGLAIVKKIVEAHKGQINVESEVGKGSTFAVLLPMA